MTERNFALERRMQEQRKIQPEPASMNKSAEAGVSPEKMRRCFNCGEELGRSRYRDPHDTCGRQECEREARNAERGEREEAHERLDEDMGYGRW